MSRFPLRRLCSALLFLALWSQLSASGEQPIPSGGTDLIPANALDSVNFWGGSGTVTLNVVSVTSPDFAQAAELNIITPAAEIWDGQLQFNLSSAVSAGDVALLQFWMRTTVSGDESGTGSLLAMVEQVGGSYAKSASSVVTAGSDWRAFYIPFSFVASYGVGGVQIKFGLGQGDPRTIQIAGVHLYNYGNSRTIAELPETLKTYGGRESDAPWRAAAAERIETYRKGDLFLTVVDAAGQPMSGQVDLDLRRHAFHFASVIDAGTLNGTGPDNEIYRQKVVELFNASGTENDLKWPPIAGDWGSNFNFNRTATALEWLRLRGFFLRGHVLVWPGQSNLPNYINSRLSGTSEQINSVPGEVLDHIDETVATYAPWVDEWDVLNEPYTNHTLMDVFQAGNPDLMAEWFVAARAAAGPNVDLYMNEFAILSGLAQNTTKIAATKATLRKIIDDGGPITGFGMQSHFDDSSLTSMTRIYAVMEEFATEFPSLRFRVTEYDVTSDDQQLQADYLRDFLTMVFSHPRFDGFQMWGFWAGRHWRPEGALFELDWTPRLQLQAYQDLLTSWQSSFAETLDGSGTLAARGFKGEYAGQLQTPGGTYDLLLPIDAATNDFVLQLPPAAAIGEAQALPTPGAGHLAITFSTQPGGIYWVETSEDATSWRPESLPQTGTGRPQVIVLAVPPETTFWRVARQ